MNLSKKVDTWKKYQHPWVQRLFFWTLKSVESSIKWSSNHLKWLYHFKTYIYKSPNKNNNAITWIDHQRVSICLFSQNSSCSLRLSYSIPIYSSKRACFHLVSSSYVYILVSFECSLDKNTWWEFWVFLL